MKKRSFVVMGVSELAAGVAWGAWVAFSQDGLLRYLGLVPAVVLLAGAVQTLLAMRLVTDSAKLAAELQRVKTTKRLDTEAEAIKERLAHFETLKQWGIISEQEFVEKRRTLLDLPEPAPAEQAGDASQRQGSLPRTKGKADDAPPGPRRENRRPRAAVTPRRPPKPSARH
ncbi:MAG: hypothetical protein LLG45_00740 [Actinomycetia bacterium]|nr:hypothetical protein [Actinomycetes bacterium]